MSDDALRLAAEVAGDRWTLLALGALRAGPLRFGELQERLAGIAPNVLVSRLRRMEAEGLVVGAAYSHRPRRYVYELTESGHDLASALPGLAGWALRHRHGVARHHAVCGTPLELRAWCPTCGTTADDATGLEVVALDDAGAGDGTPRDDAPGAVVWL